MFAYVLKIRAGGSLKGNSSLQSSLRALTDLSRIKAHKRGCQREYELTNQNVNKNGRKYGLVLKLACGGWFAEKLLKRSFIAFKKPLSKHYHREKQEKWF